MSNNDAVVEGLNNKINDLQDTIERQGKMILDYDAGCPEMVKRLRIRLAECKVHPETRHRIHSLLLALRNSERECKSSGESLDKERALVKELEKSIREYKMQLIAQG